MSAICRLASRKLAPQLAYSRKPEFITLARHVTLKAAPYKTPSVEDHDEHNAKLGRPQSPHLSIYAMEITSVLSISHRMTGAALGGYAFLLGAGALVLPEQVSHYIDALQAAQPGVLTMFSLKFILSFPFFYHFCNGIRHLIWDTGRFLTIPGVYKTGYLMLAMTTVLTLAFSCT